MAVGRTYYEYTFWRYLLSPVLARSPPCTYSGVTYCLLCLLGLLLVLTLALLTISCTYEVSSVYFDNDARFLYEGRLKKYAVSTYW